MMSKITYLIKFKRLDGLNCPSIELKIFPKEVGKTRKRQGRKGILGNHHGRIFSTSHSDKMYLILWTSVALKTPR